MRRRIRQLRDDLHEQLTSTHEANRAALVLLGFGLGIIVAGFVILYLLDPREGESFSLRQLVSDLYANGGAELLSIALTVLIIERLNRRRAEQERKEELILQMGSDNRAFAVEAARILDQKGMLKDGSLQGAYLGGANLQELRLEEEADLQGVYLEGSNLQGAKLRFANLQDINLEGANLEGAYLERAKLQEATLFATNLQGTYLEHANLQEAYLVEANLQRANLAGANLQGANLAGANLRKVGFTYGRKTIFPTCDENTILPDGTHWTPNRDWREFTHPEEWAAEQVAKKRFTFSKPPGFARGDVSASDSKPNAAQIPKTAEAVGDEPL